MNVVGPMRRSGSMPRCTHSGLHLIGGLVGGKLTESFLFSSFGGVNQGTRSGDEERTIHC